MDAGDILDRLGLRIDGQLTNAAQMLYGTKFLPRYPQALLKLGRFRGTKITGDILDNQQLHLAPSPWSARPSPGSTARCRSRRAFRRAASSEKTASRCPPKRCARPSSTR
jgi:hypothetical protein